MTRSNPTEITPSQFVTTPGDSDINAALSRVQTAMDHTLLAASADILRDIAGEHLRNHGRFFRARIALEAGLTLGVPLDQCVPLAAACELVHNASLIHDDIQDGDRQRRGQPSLWVKYGIEQAITAGDLLLMLPPLALDSREYDDGLKWRLCRCIARRSAATACGQAMEHALGQAGAASLSQYEQAANGKTGHLFAMPVEGAALLAGHDASTATALGDAALQLGVMFQIQDDLVDLYGDKRRGTPGSDLLVGKLSALVVTHLERVPSDRDALLELLTQTREETRAPEIQRWAERMLDSGTVTAVTRWADELLHSLATDPRLEPAPELRKYLVNAGISLLQRAYVHLPDETYSSPQTLRAVKKAANHGTL